MHAFEARQLLALLLSPRSCRAPIPGNFVAVCHINDVKMRDIGEEAYEAGEVFSTVVHLAVLTAAPGGTGTIRWRGEYTGIGEGPRMYAQVLDLANRAAAFSVPVSVKKPVQRQGVGVFKHDNVARGVEAENPRVVTSAVSEAEVDCIREEAANDTS